MSPILSGARLLAHHSIGGWTIALIPRVCLPCCLLPFCPSERILQTPPRVYTSMESTPPPVADPSSTGPFEARYLAFIETIADLRPRLHRYCARMMGSTLDGEDVVQDALFQAYRRLDTFDGARPLAPWLFRIAHNRCIDVLRQRGVREEAEDAAAAPDVAAPHDAVGPDVGRALERLVTALPPLERACVLLKDVFDHSLEEIADVSGSTVGGVKAALHRGRSRLAAMRDGAPGRGDRSTEAPSLARRYADRFSDRDWDGLRQLLAGDARLRVADRFAGKVSDSPYFGNYERRPGVWRAATGSLDGAPVVFVLARVDEGWRPHSAARLSMADGCITAIVDYVHCPWVLAAADSVIVDTYP
jgi:RNA polymerase sigma-70 factor, ECF subfamily